MWLSLPRFPDAAPGAALQCTSAMVGEGWGAAIKCGRGPARALITCEAIVRSARGPAVFAFVERRGWTRD